MGSEEATIKVEKEEETIKCEVEDGCNPEVNKPSDGVRAHGTRRSYNQQHLPALFLKTAPLPSTLGFPMQAPSQQILVLSDHHVHYALLPCSELHTLLSDKQGRMDSKLRGQGFRERSHAKIKIGNKIETIQFFHCYKRGVDHPMVVTIRKHLERNKKDKDSKLRLILVECRIHRLARYYKRTKKLSPHLEILCEEAAQLKEHSKGTIPFGQLVIDEAAQLKECETLIPLQLPGIQNAVLIVYDGVAVENDFLQYFGHCT
ncbi:hypothetical protein GIB67_020442 [Kingdonia uniflora]|uniref:Uncharacterized protein n=1 Tax=Kingdonia uniflora TaxID=39325 RepID=A0A7J7LUW6_9MAGN|nr:hypothetical protein GIB67_020442 [Kingdonia uniflora]